MLHRPKISPLLFLGSAAALGVGCVPPGDGISPPADRIYFPVSLTTNRTGEFLVVVNSDFDLKYAQGTIQSLDVARIRQLVQKVCSDDGDCDAGQHCDVIPTDENDGSPSFTCVGEGGVVCEGLGEKSDADLATSPGRCAPINLSKPYDQQGSLIIDVAETSAFATQGLLLERPCLEDDVLVPCAEGEAAETLVESNQGVRHPERLFVPVRGDTTVHYLDIDADGHFHCGRGVESGEATSATSTRCDESHRLSKGVTYGLNGAGELVRATRPPDPTENDDVEPPEGDPIANFRLPPEPIDLAASWDGRVVVVSHQLGGYATTLLNSWVDEPRVIHITDGLDENPVGIVGLPESDAMASGDQPGFFVTYRTNPRVDLLRFLDDGLLAAASPGGPPDELQDGGRTTLRPELLRVGGTTISLNTAGFDNRGLAVDDSRRSEATTACAGDEACLEAASKVPLDVYVTNRSPNSLLVGRTGGEDPEALISALPQFYDTVPLTAGPSRAVMGFVIGPDGEKSPRVFVLCFDSALVYVYDPKRRVVESEIRTGRGPYSIAFDEQAGLAFVGHFTDSYVGVVSLDQRHPVTFGSTVATLGDPVAPRASK